MFFSAVVARIRRLRESPQYFFGHATWGKRQSPRISAILYRTSTQNFHTELPHRTSTQNFTQSADKYQNPGSRNSLRGPIIVITITITTVIIITITITITIISIITTVITTTTIITITTVITTTTTTTTTRWSSSASTAR